VDDFGHRSKEKGLAMKGLAGKVAAIKTRFGTGRNFS
jgi:hypothetical protein